MAMDDPVAVGYRRFADDCLREARNAKFPEIREGYEKLSDEWLKLANETERLHRGGA